MAYSSNYVNNIFFYVVGIVFLIVSKVKNILKGYSDPKPFSISEHQKCIKYDIDVVEHWLSFLSRFTNGNISIKGKNILELGPGADLGVGIYLLSKGVRQYNAIDVNNLVQSVPDSFYKSFLASLKEIDSNIDIAALINELEKTKTGNPNKLNYVCRGDFNICDSFEKESIDIIFSQAAFEHFDNIEETIKQISTIVKPGGLIIAEIDLMTHSRWIRDKDPNNIYRYSNWVYELFSFRGSPNRVRPYKYREYFEKNGWKDFKVIPLKKLSNGETSIIKYAGKFQSDRNQMNYLSIMFCATKLN